MVIDPRFPGGTSAAAAAEIRALAGRFELSVHALETAMFRGRHVHQGVQQAIDEQGIELDWNPAVVRGDVVVLHNPSCLKFDTSLATRISCDTALIVTHENFLRPNGSEGFDVAACLDRIDQALVCRRRALAPVGAVNRRSVEAWRAQHGIDWPVAAFDWPNICDPPLIPPTPEPRDRRGRHSRPGFEKFPPLETMLRHFPPHAECAILGGDGFLADRETLPDHWRVLRFGEVEVDAFLAGIDFFVYFTHPQWRESFGRVVVEAIAAGKLVITDPGTAESFGDAVVASGGTDVDAIVARYVADPPAYQAFVRHAQATLERFRPAAFEAQVLARLDDLEALDHALL